MIKFTYLNFFLIMIILSILFILMTNLLHPIFTLILIILYGSIISLILSSWSHTYIYSIMLFLMMISGMLIMFLYFSSLISNEQIKILLNNPYSYLFVTNLIFLTLSMKYFNYPLKTFHEILPSFTLNTHMFNNIMYIYSYPYSNITLICILFLLLTLFTVIKICSTKSSTLRKLT